MDIQEAYRVMQEASGIGVGDMVRVLRTFKREEMGSDCRESNVNSAKISMLGRICKVRAIESGSIDILADDIGGYSFPFFALKIVEKANIPTPDKMITIDGKEYSESTIKEALREYVK